MMYSDTFIGECVQDSCDRPATVVVHENWKLCALHYWIHEMMNRYSDASLADELIAGWRSIAQGHGLKALNEDLEGLQMKLALEMGEATEVRDGFLRVDTEGDGTEIRTEMGRRIREAQHPTVFASTLAKFANYLGNDLEQFAKDLVHETGHGDADALELRMKHKDEGMELSSQFLWDLGSVLRLEDLERRKLAAAYVFDE